MEICTVIKKDNKVSITISGSCLKKGGFKVGDKAEVIVEDGKIIIIKITKAEIKELKEICAKL